MRITVSPAILEEKDGCHLRQISRKSFSGDVRSEMADEVARVFDELAEEVVACPEFVGAELEGGLWVEGLMHHFTMLTPSGF